MTISSILPYIQIVLSVLLIGTILLQKSDAGLGGAFGGDGWGGGTTSTRRGMEKTLFRATIIISILFAISAFVALII